MKKELLFTIMLVLGMMAAPVKVIGQNLLPDISIYGKWTVEGTAGSGDSPGLKWRVYREDYSNLIMQAGSGSHTTVTKNWVITATNPTTRSVDMGMLREKVSVAELTCNEIASSLIGAIGDSAFIGFENLQMVYLPQKKTISIGAYAFDGCEKLSNVSGMDYMINIGERAFAETAINCSEIGTKATASSGNIGFMAFYGCKNITDLTIDRVSTIGADAFAFCSGMSSLTLGYGVSTIGNRAFKGCDNLREIHIGENVSSITDAFSSTLNYLDEITVSEQNTSYSSDGNCLIERGTNTLILGTNSTVIPNTVKYITSNAFNGRTNLSTINIPASVTRIYNYAFDGCTNLREVWCEAETPASLYTNSFANISTNAVLYVPTIDAVTAYKNSAWNNYFSDIRVAKKEANGMSWGLIPYGTGTGKYTLWISGIEELGNFSAEGGAPWSQDIDKIVAVDVRYGVKRIGHSAFKDFGAAGTEVTFNLPSSLVSIADYAFFCCPTLKNITIPASVETIGAACFRSCPVLESVTFEEGSKLTSIAQNAFGECPTLKNVTIPASVKTIGMECFAWCSALESVTFEKGSKLTTIGKNLFYECSALKNITIPASVETIGEFCFAYCYALESVTFEEGSKLTTIGDNAFYCCEALESITIPASVETVGQYCFAWCTALESVTFGEGSKLTAIGGYAFQGCDALKSITIPASVETIGEYCFASCSALESVTYEDGSTLTSIGNYAFDYCEALKSITIPASVSKIGEYCFSVCSALESVTFEEGCILSSIANYAFNWCSALQSITIPASVVTIGEHSFAGCSKLSSVTIGESVTGIGDCAFSDIPDGAVITCLSYNQKIVDVQESSFNPNSVLRVYYTPNYSNLSSYFSRIEGIPVTITDGAVENYQDIYEEDILLSCMEYKRTLLADSRWNALYVPFELPVAEIADKYDVAYINDVRLYDSDNDGDIDENGMEVEVVYVKSGTLNANTPYLIRVKKSLSTEAKEAARNMNLSLSTRLCPAVENTFDCSSVYKTFKFSGIYSRRMSEEIPGAYAIAGDGNWHTISDGSWLNPFRIFLTIENRDGTPYQSISSAAIRNRVAGEEDGTTGINDTQLAQDKQQTVYDLQGRPVENPTKGIYIVNGKKTLIK